MSQYFDNENLESDVKLIEENIFNQLFHFLTDRGVFSKRRLDKGSRILLENINILDLESNILDLGCGYGVIGIIISKINKNVQTTGVDVNKRAIELAKKNKELNKVSNIKFLVSDVYENINSKFKTIITNPPIRAGNRIVDQFLFQAKDYLEEDGTLYFVMNKNQGAKTYLKRLEKVYKTEVLKKKQGFYVISCKLR